MTRLRLPLACLRLPLKCLRLPLAASSFGGRRWIARCAVSAFFVAALSKAVLRVAQFCDWSGATASLFEELCSPGGLHGWQLIVPQPRTPPLELFHIAFIKRKRAGWWPLLLSEIRGWKAKREEREAKALREWKELCGSDSDLD